MLEKSGGADRVAAYAEQVAAYAEQVGASVEAAAIHATKSRIFRERLADGSVSPRPGVVETVRDAKGAGTQVGLVTTTSPDNVAALLAALGPDLGPRSFDVVISAADVDRPKPDAAAYVLAVRSLDEQPGDCVPDTMTAPARHRDGRTGRVPRRGVREDRLLARVRPRRLRAREPRDRRQLQVYCGCVSSAFQVNDEMVDKPAIRE
jgi:HAD superfamily hydrolase (TIGR01509 family)